MYPFLAQPSTKNITKQINERKKKITEFIIKNHYEMKRNKGLMDLISYTPKESVLASGCEGLVARTRLYLKSGRNDDLYTRDKIFEEYSLSDILHIHAISSSLVPLRIRNEFPVYNFRLYYGVIFDDWPFYLIKPDAKISTAYAMKEQLPNSISLKDYILNEPFVNFKEKLHQIILALHAAHQYIKFTHYGLTLGDITLYKPTNEESNSLVYSLDGKTASYLSNTDGYIASIDNFVNSYCEGPKGPIVSNGTHLGEYPIAAYPIYDIYSLIMSVYKYAVRHKLVEYQKEALELLRPFMVTKSNINDAQHLLSWQDPNGEALAVSYIDYFTKIGGATALEKKSNKKVVCGIDSPMCRIVEPGGKTHDIPVLENFYDFKDLNDNNSKELVEYAIKNKLNYEAAVNVLKLEIKKYDVNLNMVNNEDNFIEAWNKVRILKKVLEVAEFFYKHPLIIGEEKYGNFGGKVTVCMDANRKKWQRLVEMIDTVGIRSKAFQSYFVDNSIY